MGCAWDPEGTECKLAFEWGELELLQYIHSHGGVLCTHFEQLCPESEAWLNNIMIAVDMKVLAYCMCFAMVAAK